MSPFFCPDSVHVHCYRTDLLLFNVSSKLFCSYSQETRTPFSCWICPVRSHSCCRYVSCHIKYRHHHYYCYDQHFYHLVDHSTFVIPLPFSLLICYISFHDPSSLFFSCGSSFLFTFLLFLYLLIRLVFSLFIRLFFSLLIQLFSFHLIWLIFSLLIQLISSLSIYLFSSLLT